MLYGATVRGKSARGKIKRISFSAEINWDEYVIATAQDIPGKNYIALILDDQPCLADGFINHREEPVVLLAHSNKYALAKAVEGVLIESTPFAAIYSMAESEKQTEIIWGTDNVFNRFLIENGDVHQVWAHAD